MRINLRRAFLPSVFSPPADQHAIHMLFHLRMCDVLRRKCKNIGTCKSAFYPAVTFPLVLTCKKASAPTFFFCSLIHLTPHHIRSWRKNKRCAMTRAAFTLSFSLLFSFNRASKVRVTYCTKGSETARPRSDPPPNHPRRFTVRIPTGSRAFLCWDVDM